MDLEMLSDQIEIEQLCARNFDAVGAEGQRALA